MIERTIPPLAHYVDPALFRALGFVQTVKGGGLAHYAGIAPLQGDLSGLHVVGEEDMAAQLAFVLRVLDDCLRADGLGREHLLHWTIHTTDMPACLALGAEFAAWVGAHPPAATTVGVAALAHPAQLLEITAVAALP